MAVKNWLIRTKNKQILGPATKDKVIELIEKGSLTSEDEIACGNGYWFWVKEKDLLEKYLYGDLPQTFNPISEAVDVLTAKTSPEGITASVLESPQKAKEKAESPNTTQLPADDDLAYPEGDDLEYPDMGEPVAQEAAPEASHENIFEDNSLTGEIELGSALKSTPEPAKPKAPPTPTPTPEPAGDDDNYIYPSAADLEYPEDIHGNSSPESDEEDEGLDDDQTDPNVQIPSEEEVAESEEYSEEGAEGDEEEAYEEDYGEEYEEEEPENHPLQENGKKKKRRAVEVRKGSDRYLIIIALLIVVAIAVVFYYYKMVLNKPFPIVGMNEAHAQTITSLSKKKVS